MIIIIALTIFSFQKQCFHETKTRSIEKLRQGIVFNADISQCDKISNGEISARRVILEDCSTNRPFIERRLNKIWNMLEFQIWN